MMRRWIGMVAVWALLTVSSAPVDADAPVLAGASVVGLGNFPGAPELDVHTSGGNDVVQVLEGSAPVAYGGGASNVANSCLGSGVGFADVGSGTYAYTTKNHEYVFTFAAGVSVTSFSLTLLDWGDLLPYGVNESHWYEVVMTGYAADDSVVASDALGFTTDDTTSSHRVTEEFGDLGVAGDACLATAGRPGRCPLAVSGTGIVRVTLNFEDPASMDPNIALAELHYTVTPPPPTPHGVEGFGFWKNHSSWPAGPLTVGGVSYTQEQAVALLETPVAGDVTYVLFRQALAATLNVLDGNESDCITTTLAAANAWLAANPVGSGLKANSAAWTTLGASLADVLEQYNDGELCGAPGG
jgi:hypothetical protein